MTVSNTDPPGSSQEKHTQCFKQLHLSGWEFVDLCQALAQDTGHSQPSSPGALCSRASWAGGMHTSVPALFPALASPCICSDRVNTSYLCFHLPSPNPPDSKPPPRAMLRPMPSPCWSLLLQHRQILSLQATLSKLLESQGVGQCMLRTPSEATGIPQY